MDSKNTNTKRDILVVTILVIVLLSSVIYVYATRTQKVSSIRSPTDVFLMFKSATEDLGRVVTEGLRLYQNEHLGFSFLYPRDMTVKKVEEGAGAVTIIFEGAQNAQGFQMFIVPYKEVVILEERFLRDVPSGVRTNVEQVFIDGTEGVAFDSHDAFLGATKEVWFIHKGFLYEMTAPKNLDGWLAEILITWKFL